jgi:UDP-2,3-diacylglucosamine hydrolase
VTTALISDLHLDASRPQVTALFKQLVAGEARGLEALYILGDLFEAWVGDDDTDPHHDGVRRSLRALTESGVAAYFMRGNRDFLIGERFAADTGMHVLEDPVVIDLYGTPTLLTHGDTLCTDDLAYQAFRKTVHDPAWQQAFLSQPIEARRAMAGEARAESRRHQQNQAPEIMDVNQDAVVEMMRSHGITRMIHGHTHRPNVHHFTVDGVDYTRIVLGDWYEQGSILRCDADGCRLEQLPL